MGLDVVAVPTQSISAALPPGQARRQGERLRGSWISIVAVVHVGDILFIVLQVWQVPAAIEYRWDEKSSFWQVRSTPAETPSPTPPPVEPQGMCCQHRCLTAWLFFAFQQFHEGLACKARKKLRSPSWSS